MFVLKQKGWFFTAAGKFIHRTAANDDPRAGSPRSATRSGSSARRRDGLRSVCRLAKDSSNPNSSVRSFSHSAGGVPPRPCSISGRVGTPGGHRSGVRSAIHLISVVCSRLVAGLAYFSPMPTRNESLRWHTIWRTVMRPHFGLAFGSRRWMRSTHAALTRGSASVLIDCYFDSGL